MQEWSASSLSTTLYDPQFRLATNEEKLTLQTGSCIKYLIPTVIIIVLL